MLIPRIRITGVKVLLTGWSRVVRVFYDMVRRDGTVQAQDRDLLDRGDGVTVLLHTPDKSSVLLLKQPRVTAYIREEGTGETIEACNGQVEPGENPLSCALREIEQETGYRLTELVSHGHVYASPGASLELIYLFSGAYTPERLTGQAGGLADEGEDIETFELAVEEAFKWIEDGKIRDARTILAFYRTMARIDK